MIGAFEKWCTSDVAYPDPLLRLGVLQGGFAEFLRAIAVLAGVLRRFSRGDVVCE